MSDFALRAQCEIAHACRYEMVQDYVVQSSRDDGTEPRELTSVILRQLTVSSLSRLAGVQREKLIRSDHLLAPLQPITLLSPTISVHDGPGS